MNNWTPDPSILNSFIEILLAGQSTDNSRQQWAYTTLIKWEVHPEFCLYLIYIFSNIKVDESVRHLSGLKFRAMLADRPECITSQALLFFKSLIPQLIPDQSRIIKLTLGSILAALIQRTSDSEVLNLILNSLNDINNIEWSLDALMKISEDCPDVLFDKPNFFIKMIELLYSSNFEHRKYSLKIINHFIIEGPQSLVVNMGNFVNTLFNILNDEHDIIKEMVCHSFSILISHGITHIAPRMAEVFGFILKCMENITSSLALEACDFWYEYLDTIDLPCSDIFVQYLNKIVPALLKAMIIQEEELYGDEDTSIPDNPRTINPNSTSAKDRYASIKPDENISVWNIRKCAASSLDHLARYFHNVLFPDILHLLEQLLKDHNWKHVEIAVLAIGAIAEGCMAEMEPNLPGLIPFLMQFTQAQYPTLLRSIAIWSISRYVVWIANYHDESFFKMTLECFMLRVHDRNKAVQKAGCIAFARLEEAAGLKLVPYLRPILGNFMFAFNLYQTNNLRILLDVINVLAEEVGSNLNEIEYIQIFMPPLISKFNLVSNEDLLIITFFECFSSIAKSLRSSFLPYAPIVFQRCMQIIPVVLAFEHELLKEQNNDTKMDLPEYDYLVAALDALCGMMEGIHASIESLIAQVNFPQILLQCLQSPNNNVRQSAFAVLGELGKSCIGHLRPALDQFILLIGKNLDPSLDDICNNASWSLGQITMSTGPDIQGYVSYILPFLIEVLKIRSITDELAQNIAITIGCLGCVVPNAISIHLNQFAEPWCHKLTWIEDEEEKCNAYLGLCKVVSANPTAMLQDFRILWYAVASWPEMPVEILNQFKLLWNNYKSFLSGAWQEHFNKIESDLAQDIVHMMEM